MLELGAWAAGALIGARRWLNRETAVAVLASAAVIAVVVGCVALYGAGSRGAAAKRDASWMHQINTGMARIYKARAERAERAQAAADAERVRIEAERDAAMSQSAAVAAELAKATDDPIVFPRALARELR